MASGGIEDNNYDPETSFKGMGRGLLLKKGADKDSANLPQFRNKLRLEDTMPIPKVQPVTSTPNAFPASNEMDTTQQLRDMIEQLGHQIGDSIATRLLASQDSDTTPSNLTPASGTSFKKSDSTHVPSFDLTKVNVVVKSDVREPPIFRGDGSEKCTVQEWIEMVEMYLHKRGYSTSEQAGEILSHLMGRAKNIVKVGLKSNSLLNPASNPEIIFDILKRYFSESPMSCLPLADFYATQPKSRESPVDYWVRLNTAAEVADEYLQKQGRKMENMSGEIAMMFIRNCPDLDLAGVFRCKPISKWTVVEVQEAIDEHQREHKPCNQKVTNSEKVKVQQVAAADASFPAVNCEEYGAMNVGVRKPNNPPKAHDPVVSEGTALERVLSMLEKVLEKANQTNNHGVVSQPRGDAVPWNRPVNLPCRVCEDKTHSTRSHCMGEKRCFACFGVGHQKKECTNVKTPTTQPKQVRGNTVQDQEN